MCKKYTTYRQMLIKQLYFIFFKEQRCFYFKMWSTIYFRLLKKIVIVIVIYILPLLGDIKDILKLCNKEYVGEAKRTGEELIITCTAKIVKNPDDGGHRPQNTP